MSQNEMYNPSQPSYGSPPATYKLQKDMNRAYSSGGSTEGSGVITVPTLSVLP